MDAGDLELVRRMIRDAGMDAEQMAERDRMLRESVTADVRQYVDMRIDERAASLISLASVPAPVIIEETVEAPADDDDAVTETLETVASVVEAVEAVEEALNDTSDDEPEPMVPATPEADEPVVRKSWIDRFLGGR